ncbi:MAG: ATP-binding protein [Cyanobacteria bacterium P01_D01_bin.36]
MPTTSVTETIAKMHQTRSTYAIVVEQRPESQPESQPKSQPENGNLTPYLVGLFTERDLVRAVASDQSFAEVAIATVIDPHVPTMLAQNITSATEIFVRMRQQHVRYLPVIRTNGQLAGIITEQSLRRSLSAPYLLKFKSVSEVIATQVTCISQTASVIRAAQLMASQNVSCVIATDDSNFPIGIITERDIVQFKALALDTHNTCIAQVMSTPLFLIGVQDALWLAHQKMNQHRVRRLVACTPTGNLVGLVTQDSILQALDSADSQQIVALLQQEVMQLHAEKQTLLKARNRELEQSQLTLSCRLESQQLEQRKTQEQLEVAYQKLEQSHDELSKTNKALNDTLQELQDAQQALKQTNIELESSVEHRTSDLLRAEGRWRSLLEKVHLVVIGLDQAGKVNYANPFFLQLTGYNAEDVLEKSWFENFVPHDEYDHTYQYFQNLMIDGANANRTNANRVSADEASVNRANVPRYQNAILTCSGSTRVINWNNVALRDRSNNIIGTMSIGEDITDRLAVDRVKGEFVSVVSHELRTPLTAIHGGLHLITSGLVASNSHQGKELLQVAAENSQRLVRLVNDILELERLESGKAKLNPKKVVSQQITSQAVHTFKVAANTHKLTIEVSDPGLELMADSDRLTQVLTNLLDNAIKFSPENATIWISVEKTPSSPETGEATALFQVKDEGRGIPSENLSEMFERFTQINYDDSREKGGTGLGLAICHNIVRQHGGRIWVKSKLGEGSCFFFTVPLFYSSLQLSS